MCFLFNDTATTEIYTLSLHDALPISNGQAGGLEGGCGLGAKRRAEVVAAAFGAELSLQLAELLRQARAASHLRLAPYALGPGDDRSVGFFPRRTEGLHQLSFLGHRTGPPLPQRRRAPGFLHAKLEPLELLAGHGVFRQRGHPVLEVEAAEV